MKTKLLITVLALSFSTTAFAQRREPETPLSAILVEEEMNRVVEDGEPGIEETEEEDAEAAEREDGEETEEAAALEDEEMNHAAQENPVFLAPAGANSNIVGE